MATDNNNKILKVPNSGNVPRLRFPEFSGEWVKVYLSEICERVTRKNKNNRSKLPLTISAQYGLVDQITFFNKVVASADMSNYYLLKKGEFAYNKSYSSDYPWGAIKRLDRYDEGALSSLYICFEIKKCTDSDFIVQYFESPKWYREVSNIAGEGARNHGLLNIAIGDFFNTKHYLPSSINEQQKIAKLLLLIDQRIETQNKIIEDLKKLKVAITQKISKDKSNRKVILSELLTERCEKNKELYPVHSVSVSEGIINQVDYLGRSFAANDISNYNVVYYGDIVYTKSPTGDFPYGIVKMSSINAKVSVSPLYGVYQPCSDSIGIYLHNYFCNPLNAKNYLHKLIQKGAKNTINITNKRFLENEISLPNENLLKEYALFISSFELKIKLEQKTLLLLQQQKQYLLQQMFI